MKNYYTLEPDKFYPLKSKHYTVGRAGQKIEFITRHHLMYIGEVEAVVDRIWNSRPASAHVVIGPKGRWGQAVGDASTAWANASQWANQRTIAIEHSNNTGKFPGGNDYHDKSWNISDETLIEGARVAAAYCLHEKLGRPVYGKNIRDHNEFTSTGCPVHLQGPRPGNAWGGKAGKYHQKWMDEAQRFYDALVNKSVNPDGTPKNIPSTTPTIQEDDMAFTDEDRKMLRTVYAELTKKFPSRSAYRTSDEQVDTLAGFVLNVDGRQHEEAVGNAAKASGLTAEQVVEKLREGKNFAEIREEAHDA